MTSLANLAAADTLARPDHKCGICWALETLDPTAAAYLQAAIDNASVKAAEIQRALATEGHDVGANTVSRHRRALCAGRRMAA